jgi:hypothetical protein
VRLHLGKKLGENFLDSRELVYGVRDPQMEIIVHLLSDPREPYSAWNLCPWNTDLSK